MRYRDATSRPGRKRPSFNWYSAELEGRDDGFPEDPDAGRGGNGEVAVAKSSVATSSVFATGLPQAEQKATLSGSSVPQFEHLTMKISRSSLPRHKQILPAQIT